MNIALINSEYPSTSSVDHGGIATYTYVMANALAHKGHTVHIIARNGTIPDSLLPGINFHEIDRQYLSLPGRAFERLKSDAVAWEAGYSRACLSKVLQIHSRTPLRVVEIPDYNGLAATFKGNLPFPVIIHFHTPSRIVDQFNASPITRRARQWYRFEERSFQNAAAYVSPSDAMKREAVHRFGIPADRITIIRHPVDMSLFSQVPRRHHREDRIEVLFVGRLERRKGAHILVSALPSILAIDHRIHLTIAGHYGTNGHPCFREAIERNLTELARKRVWFVGPVRREQLPALYVNSDLFLFPSLFENAPYALFEAIAAGVPTVAANVAGSNEIVEHGRTGYLFDPQNQKSLIEALERAITNRQEAIGFAQAAKEQLHVTYNPVKAAQETVDFYQSLPHCQ